MMPSRRSRTFIETNQSAEPQTSLMQQTKENRVVRRTIVVNADVQRAFQVFTQNMGQWWPKEHHTGGTPPVAVVVEPRAGGRWYEKGEDGSECDWGTVLDWEPPTRAVLSLAPKRRLRNSWPDITRGQRGRSSVQCRKQKDRTRVELEHRHFERHGESGDRLQTAGRETWPVGLTCWENMANSWAGQLSREVTYRDDFTDKSCNKAGSKQDTYFTARSQRPQRLISAIQRVRLCDLCGLVVKSVSLRGLCDLVVKYFVFART